MSALEKFKNSPSLKTVQIPTFLFLKDIPITSALENEPEKLTVREAFEKVFYFAAVLDIPDEDAAIDDFFESLEAPPSQIIKWGAFALENPYFMADAKMHQHSPFYGDEQDKRERGDITAAHAVQSLIIAGIWNVMETIADEQVSQKEFTALFFKVAQSKRFKEVVLHLLAV